MGPVGVKMRPVKDLYAKGQVGYTKHRGERTGEGAVGELPRLLKGGTVNPEEAAEIEHKG